jgi:hypothetical protein
MAFGKAVGNGGTLDGYTGCNAGGLNLTPPSSFAWPSTTLNGKNLTESTNLSLAPDDETGSGAGWNLAITSTTLTNGAGKTLPASATTLTAATSVAGTGSCTLPANSISYPLTIPAGPTAPAAAKVYNAASATGAGPSNISLSLSLAVPANAATGTYTSTWTITLASGP